MFSRHLHFVIFLAMLVSVNAGNIDPAKGLVKAQTSHLDGINQKTDAEFIPVDKGLKQDQDGLISFVVPAENAKQKITYAYVGLGPIPVKEMRKYALCLKINLKYGFVAIFSATFYQGDKPLSFSKIYAQGAADSPPMVESRCGFAVPPGAEKMILWIGVGTVGGKLLYPGVHMTAADIRLEETGELRSHDDAENLLPVSGFDNVPTGPVSAGKYGFFPGPVSNRVSTEIVENERKTLHLEYKKGDYPYPLFRSPERRYCGSLAKFTCRIRGKGRVTPTIWWYRKHVGHYYDGALPVTLTDQWQRIEVFSYCRDASVSYASCAMICHAEKVNMDIDEVSFIIVGTDRSK